MEQLCKDIVHLQNMVYGYRPASFGKEAERKERSDILTSQYDDLFDRLQQCVEEAMCKRWLAYGVLDDEEAKQVAINEDAMAMEEVYGAIDREY